MGAIMGLTALLSGCDENQEKVLAACDMAGVQVRAVYHQRHGEFDYVTLDFYKENKIVASVIPFRSEYPNWVQYDDGRKLNLSSGDPNAYFSSEKKEAK